MCKSQTPAFTGTGPDRNTSTIAEFRDTAQGLCCFFFVFLFVIGKESWLQSFATIPISFGSKCCIVLRSLKGIKITGSYTDCEDQDRHTQTHMHSHENKDIGRFLPCQTTNKLRSHQKNAHAHTGSHLSYCTDTEALNQAHTHAHTHTLLQGVTGVCCLLRHAVGFCRAVPWCLKEPCSTIGTWQPHG